MPTITCTLKDLNSLAGTQLTVAKLDEKVTVFKGELKDYDAETDELKIEITDTNRPDLWSVEGVARQLRTYFSQTPPAYDFFAGKIPDRTMIVDPKMESIRPFAAGFAVTDVDVSEAMLISLIQTQEKLTDNLGRHRKSVSIGIYDLDQIVFPVHYKAVGRQEVRFVPLGYEQELTPEEIIKQHPKGIEYGPILDGHEMVPMLMDSSGDIMSFPPIINSRSSGEVKVGRRNLFIEATGTLIEQVLLALNIFAVNLSDRGGRIVPVRIKYDFDTPLGREFSVPYQFAKEPMNLTPVMVEKHLGVKFTPETMMQLLRKYGYPATASESDVSVPLIPWRNDALHSVDIIEDIAISAGYNSFEPEPMKDYTIGLLAPITAFSDRIRDIMLGFGFEEIISNILCNRQEFAVMMREPDRDLIEIKNPMSETYSAIRDRVLPSLLRVERDSSGAAYPHRIFETGEVTIRDDATVTGCRTIHRLAVLLADNVAELSTLYSFLELLLYQLGLESQLVPDDKAEFIPGRSGRISIKSTPVGWLGEIHPEVLESYQITMPCAAFEIDLTVLKSLM